MPAPTAVNGVVHRDWLSRQPTTIEHVGDTLTVTSPGGFLGGVTPDNIITHPAVPRYRSMAEAMARLGLAEREGIGVDRMVRDMLAIGRPAPAISETDGSCVRVTLLGGPPPDAAVVALVAELAPARAGNVDSLLLIEHLTRHGWVDADSAAGVLQRSSPDEAREAILRLAEAHLDPDRSRTVITPVRGVPAHQSAAFIRGRNRDAGQAGDIAAKKRFDALHRLSVVVNLVQMLAVLMVLVRYAAH